MYRFILIGLLDYFKSHTMISNSLIHFLVTQSKIISYISDRSDLLKDIDKFLTTLFSHGLVNIRTPYLKICEEIGNHDIVVAIEYQDGLAVFSYKGGGYKVVEHKFFH
ncbi:hypothetical protein K502DRAFT_365064 [Neoconidiobolus thromboides FSU 785]|nr:hypothetical protein K502DRAFT_365064 [Neoconidiobolus thromboides FSU 785]